MYDIHLDHLEHYLHQAVSTTPIRIRFKNGKIEETVYLKHFYNNKFWAFQQGCVDLNIFPSRIIEILKIGPLVVQSEASWNEQKEIYKEYKKEEKQKLIKKSYRNQIQSPRN